MSLLQVVETSDGFITTVFPAASAPTTGFNSSMIGKFQGAMTVTTPYGSFQTWTTKGGGAARGRTGGVVSRRQHPSQAAATLVTTTTQHSTLASGSNRSRSTTTTQHQHQEQVACCILAITYYVPRFLAHLKRQRLDRQRRRELLLLGELLEVLLHVHHLRAGDKAINHQQHASKINRSRRVNVGREEGRSGGEEGLEEDKEKVEESEVPSTAAVLSSRAETTCQRVLK